MGFNNTQIVQTPSWLGRLDTAQDAMLLVEAARKGNVNIILTRLNDEERRRIASGTVFVWVESPGMKRWTDGIKWGPSMVSGAFLIYHQILDNIHQPVTVEQQRRVLQKKTFAMTSDQSERFHVVSYLRPQDVDSGYTPRDDPLLASQAPKLVNQMGKNFISNIQKVSPLALNYTPSSNDSQSFALYSSTNYDNDNNRSPTEQTAGCRPFFRTHTSTSSIQSSTVNDNSSSLSPVTDGSKFSYPFDYSSKLRQDDSVRPASSGMPATRAESIKQVAIPPNHLKRSRSASAENARPAIRTRSPKSQTQSQQSVHSEIKRSRAVDRSPTYSSFESIQAHRDSSELSDDSRSGTSLIPAVNLSTSNSHLPNLRRLMHDHQPARNDLPPKVLCSEDVRQLKALRGVLSI